MSTNSGVQPDESRYKKWFDVQKRLVETVTALVYECVRWRFSPSESGIHEVGKDGRGEGGLSRGGIQSNALQPAAMTESRTFYF